MLAFALFLLFLTSCSSNASDRFLAQGRAINQELLHDLEEIQDIDALLVILPQLERRFNQLVEVMIQARRYQIKKKCSWQPLEEDRLLSKELAQELHRIYQIPAARSLIEKSQESALMKLDAFENKMRKIADNSTNKNFNGLE